RETPLAVTLSGNGAGERKGPDRRRREGGQPHIALAYKCGMIDETLHSVVDRVPGSRRADGECQIDVHRSNGGDRNGNSTTNGENGRGIQCREPCGTLYIEFVGPEHAVVVDVTEKRFRIAGDRVDADGAGNGDGGAA